MSQTVCADHYFSFSALMKKSYDKSNGTGSLSIAILSPSRGTHRNNLLPENRPVKVAFDRIIPNPKSPIASLRSRGANIRLWSGFHERFTRSPFGVEIIILPPFPKTLAQSLSAWPGSFRCSITSPANTSWKHWSLNGRNSADARIVTA